MFKLNNSKPVRRSESKSVVFLSIFFFYSYPEFLESTFFFSDILERLFLRNTRNYLFQNTLRTSKIPTNTISLEIYSITQ